MQATSGTAGGRGSGGGHDQSLGTASQETTLNGCIDLYTTEFPPSSAFKHFENDVHAAVLLYHRSSGLVQEQEAPLSHLHPPDPQDLLEVAASRFDGLIGLDEDAKTQGEDIGSSCTCVMDVYKNCIENMW